MITLVTKAMFFDRGRVRSAADRANRAALSKAGAFVRQTARRSIRKRKGVSAPGRPPHSHEGTLRRLIWFGYDRRRQSVVIGPAASSKGAAGRGLQSRGAPSLLEFGGRVTRLIVRRRRGRWRGRRVRMVYRPRPYMGPALAKEAPNFPKLWADTVRA